VKETKLKTVANILATAIVMGLRSTLMGLVITIMGGSVPAQAFLPLASLAGNFAGYGNGTFALCFNSGFSQTVDCKAAAHTVFYSQVSVDQGASDTKGKRLQYRLHYQLTRISVSTFSVKYSSSNRSRNNHIL
jgi:hypothetical protein